MAHKEKIQEKPLINIEQTKKNKKKTKKTIEFFYFWHIYTPTHTKASQDGVENVKKNSYKHRKFCNEWRTEA